MITLIKSTHHVGSFFALQPTAAAMFWRQTGVSTTSCILLHPFRKNWFGLSACMPYMLGPCQWFAFKSICFWPNGLWQIGNMWEKNGKNQKHNLGGPRVCGPSVVPAWKLQICRGTHNVCRGTSIVCPGPKNHKIQFGIIPAQKMLVLLGEYRIFLVVTVTCCDHVWKHF